MVRDRDDNDECFVVFHWRYRTPPLQDEIYSDDVPRFVSSHAWYGDKLTGTGFQSVWMVPGTYRELD